MCYNRTINKHIVKGETMTLEAYYRADINFIAFIVLSIYVFYSIKSLDLTDKMNRLFIFISTTVLFQLLFEAATVMINRVDVSWFVELSYVLHVLLFVTGAIIAYTWFFFLLNFVLRPNEIPKSVHVLAGIMLATSLFLALSSPLTGWVFSVTSDNVYVRGPLFLIQIVITYLFIFSAALSLFLFRSRVTVKDRRLLLIFGLFPIALGSVQVFVYGVLLIWSSIAFAFVIGSIHLQERMLQTDDLTHAVTRASFMSHMERKILRGIEDTLGMVFVDLDGLKAINDQFGHAEGDHALRTIVGIIKENIGIKDSVVRMGGDEFLIVIDTESHARLIETMDRIEAALKRYNDSSDKPYRIEFCYGADLFTVENMASMPSSDASTTRCIKQK